MAGFYLRPSTYLPGTIYSSLFNIENSTGAIILAAKSTLGNGGAYMILDRDTQNVGINITGASSPQYTLDVAGDINCSGNFKVNGVNISSNYTYTFNNPLSNFNNTISLSSNGDLFNVVNNQLNIKSLNFNAGIGAPSYINGSFMDLGNNYAYVKFTTNDTITFLQTTICDLLVVGAGGRGGTNIYSGGGGAGEVVYYPNYSFTTGSYSIQIGVDSSTTTNRISKIYQGITDLITAKGGGDGASISFENVDRRFPPKKWTSIITAENSTTFNGFPSSNMNVNLNTTGITYGSGDYYFYYSYYALFKCCNGINFIAHIKIMIFSINI